MNTVMWFVKFLSMWSSQSLYYSITWRVKFRYCIEQWSTLHCIHIKADWCVHWMTSVLTCKKKKHHCDGRNCISFYNNISFFPFSLYKEMNIQLLYNSQKRNLQRYEWSAICCALLDHSETVRIRIKNETMSCAWIHLMPTP